MKRLCILLFSAFAALSAMAQGWPAQHQGVMLQGFYWDSYDDTKWTKLTSEAKELGQYFNLVWIPQSANCGGTSMGYDPLYWFTNYNSSFGTKDELLALINALKANGVGTIADVVINHRKNVSTWTDFPAETYQGVTYQLTYNDICSNDEAAAAGHTVGPNADTGEGWPGMRDLDHKSTNVQQNVKAYLKMLLDEMGYAGFRYDMVKGYGATYTALYNSYANPTYSVGEYWDGNATTVKNWINGTKTGGNIQSAAFDFPFRYTVRDAINNSDWRKLANASVVSDADYKRYAVTFVENHDTERRSNAEQDPIKKDTLAANAYLLAMPGTPCIFLKHWQDCKRDIKAMIEARNTVGIHNQSAYINMAANQNYYAVRTTGTEGKMLLAVVGNGAATYTPAASQWTKVLEGYHYAYYMANTMNTAWVDLPSGDYQNAQQATLTAVTNDNSAQLVYTTDGTTPTATSNKAANGTQINIPVGTTTLKVGLLIGGTVTGIVTRQYNIIEFTPYTITAYVNTTAVGWSYVNFWTWGGDGSHAPTKTSWPGDKVTATKEVNGKTWFYKEFTINSPTDAVNFVFSTNSGSPQTVNVEGINQDAYFEISTEKDGANYKVNNVTPTGIRIVKATTLQQPVKVYTADGRLVRTMPTGSNVQSALDGLPHGLYVIGKKKFVK